MTTGTFGAVRQKNSATVCKCAQLFPFLNPGMFFFIFKSFIINLVRDRTPGEQLAHPIASIEQVNWKSECEWEGPGQCKFQNGSQVRF